MYLVRQLSFDNFSSVILPTITHPPSLPTPGFSIEGPSEARIECKDLGDGSADVTYLPTCEGEYALHVLCQGEDIPDSPFMADIRPAVATLTPQLLGKVGAMATCNFVIVTIYIYFLLLYCCIVTICLFFLYQPLTLDIFSSPTFSNLKMQSFLGDVLM